MQEFYKLSHDFHKLGYPNAHDFHLYRFKYFVDHSQRGLRCHYAKATYEAFKQEREWEKLIPVLRSIGTAPTKVRTLVDYILKELQYYESENKK